MLQLAWGHRKWRNSSESGLDENVLRLSAVKCINQHQDECGNVDFNTGETFEQEGIMDERAKICTTGGAKSSPAPGDAPEILIADDNPADVYLIREALKEHGVTCAIHVAPDGKEVLQIISGTNQRTAPQQFSLIILDLNLPRHDGLEILQRLRDTPGMDGVPVVVLTSSDSPRDRDLANHLGAAYYLRKPSSLDQFLALGAVFKNLLAQPRTTLRHV